MFRLPSRLCCMDIMRFASLAQLLPLSREHLAQIAPYASERSIPAGRRLLLGGPFAQELVLIAGGRAIVGCAGETVDELGPGDAFGDLAPERPLYATASVTARTDLRLVVFSVRAIRELRATLPQTVEALVAACAAGPAERAAGGVAAPALKLVRDAA
jgi:CRP-like cAMP-binding protein